MLTTTTTTGFAFANRKAGERMEVIYSPLDFWPIMRRAYAVIRPIRVVLVEAEVWPNLAGEARGRGIPLALVNARLSQRSERRFHPFPFPGRADRFDVSISSAFRNPKTFNAGSRSAFRPRRFITSAASSTIRPKPR